VRILVLGGDGYLGWPTALHLSDRGHDVGVLDNFARRSYDDEMGVRSLVPWLARVNIPAPVCGGLPLAGLLAVLHSYGYQPLAFTTTLQVPLQNTFFASIGFAASLTLMRRGGPLVFGFFLLALVVVVCQNLLGGAVAWMLGQHPLMGVLAGSVTMAGGPATGLAFAPLFEQAGVPGAATLAVAAAMALGPNAGLALLGGLDERIGDHHRLHSVRAHLLEQAGDIAGAIAGFEAAAARTANQREQHYLTTRAAHLASGPPDG